VFDRPRFPAGTLAANLFGCLLIGLLAGLIAQRRVFESQMRWLVFVGILAMASQPFSIRR
jgi:fluoride ion exporter CrcB/FEX